MIFNILSHILIFLYSLNILYTYNYSNDDIIRIQKIIVGLETPTEVDFLLYDNNHSYTIKANDIVYIQRYVSSNFSDQIYFANLGNKYIIKIINNQINGLHIYLYNRT